MFVCKIHQNVRRRNDDLIVSVGLLWRLSQVQSRGCRRSFSSTEELALQSRNAANNRSMDHCESIIMCIWTRTSFIDKHCRLIQEYWWAVLLMGVAFVLFMGVFIKCCAVHTPSSNPKKPPALSITQTLRHPYSTLRRKRHHHPQQQQNANPTAPYIAAPNPTGGGEPRNQYNRPKGTQVILSLSPRAELIFYSFSNGSSRWASEWMGTSSGIVAVRLLRWPRGPS